MSSSFPWEPVRLQGQWELESQGKPGFSRVAVRGTLRCRPQLSPGERIYQLLEVRLYRGPCQVSPGSSGSSGSPGGLGGSSGPDGPGNPGGVTAHFLVAFHFLRGTPLYSREDCQKVWVTLIAPPPPRGRLQVHGRCTGAAATEGGRLLLAEVHVHLHCGLEEGKG